MKGYSPDLAKDNIELNSKSQTHTFIELGTIQETKVCDCSGCEVKECNCDYHK